MFKLKNIVTHLRSCNPIFVNILEYEKKILTHIINNDTYLIVVVITRH